MNKRRNKVVQLQVDNLATAVHQCFQKSGEREIDQGHFTLLYQAELPCRKWQGQDLNLRPTDFQSVTLVRRSTNIESKNEMVVVGV